MLKSHAVKVSLGFAMGLRSKRAMLRGTDCEDMLEKIGTVLSLGTDHSSHSQDRVPIPRSCIEVQTRCSCINHPPQGLGTPSSQYSVNMSRFSASPHASAGDPLAIRCNFGERDFRYWQS